MILNGDDPSEVPFPIIMCRCASNALSYYLKDTEGIVCQGEDEDGIMQIYLIHRKDNQIIYSKGSANFTKKDVGKLFWVHESEADAIVAATIDGTEVWINE
jgi:hypothetical protein